MKRITILVFLFLLHFMNLSAIHPGTIGGYQAGECAFSENVEVLNESISIRFIDKKSTENRFSYTFDVKDETPVYILFYEFTNKISDSGPVIRLDEKNIELVPFNARCDDYYSRDYYQPWRDSICTLYNLNKQIHPAMYSYYLGEALNVGTHTLDIEFTDRLSHTSLHDLIRTSVFTYGFLNSEQRTSNPSLTLHIDVSALKNGAELFMNAPIIAKTESQYYSLIKPIEVNPVYTNHYEAISGLSFRIRYIPKVNKIAQFFIDIRYIALLVLFIGLIACHLFLIQRFRIRSSQKRFPAIVFLGILIPFLTGLGVIFYYYFMRLLIGDDAIPMILSIQDLISAGKICLFLGIIYLPIPTVINDLLKALFRKGKKTE